MVAPVPRRKVVIVSLDAPGGNITGVFNHADNLRGVPHARRFFDDPDVVAFEAAKQPTPMNDRIDSILADENIMRGVIGMLAERLSTATGGPPITVADLIADIKRLK